METTRVTEMTDAEFSLMRRKAALIPVSPFAEFCKATKDYVFKTRTGSQLDKWEVWEMGYTDAEKLKSGQYPIIATLVEKKEAVKVE